MPKTRPRALTRAAVGALTGALLACTTVAVQAAAVAPQLAAPGMQPLAVGQDEHSAFPGMTREPSGVLRLVFRQGPNHMAGGRIVTAESWDDGQTWTNPQTIRANPDYRDPFIANIDGINYLTWFGAQPGNPAMGAGMMRAWNSESRRIDTLARAAISAPIVKLPDGRLATAFYGQKAGESTTLWTAWMAWSSDNGWTWQTNRIINELAAGRSTAEPYLVVNGPWTHMLVRWGNDSIGIRSSSDSGVSWPAPARKILDNATGRPTVIPAAGGMLVMVYREASTGNAAMAYSVDNAQSWQPAGTVLAAPAGGQMTYAAMVRAADEPDEIRLVVGMEQAGGVTSQLYGGTVVLP